MARETGFLWLISGALKLSESQLVTKPQERGASVMQLAPFVLDWVCVGRFILCTYPPCLALYKGSLDN